jgi:hypothetical protein
VNVVSQHRARCLLAASITIGASLIVFRGVFDYSQRLTATIGLILAVTALILTSKMINGRPFSLGFAYLLLFSLFHLGVFPYISLDAKPHLFDETHYGWFRNPEFSTAVYYVTLATAAFLVGYSALLSVAHRRVRLNRTPTLDLDAHRSAMASIGCVVLGTGLLLWFSVAISHFGLGFVGTAYLSYLDATRNSPLPYAHLFIGVGLACVGLSPSRTLRRLALASFGLFAVPAFFLGLRGEVIIPVMSYVVAVSRVQRRNTKMRFALLFTLLFAGLSLGSLVRQVRGRGLSSIGEATISANPLDGLAELGSSIYTVFVVHEWHDVNLEPYIGWGTYWAPIQRVLIGRILGLPTPETGNDVRVFSSTILERLGPFGGSPVAESYRAAGVLGICLVLGVIGLCVAGLDLRPDGSLFELLIGPLGYVLLLWVRNDFTPVLTDGAFCFALAAVALLSCRLGPRRRGLSREELVRVG